MLKSQATHPALTDHLLPGPGLLRAAGLCLGFSVFTALMAQLSIPLPFTPVPVTGQTLAVLLTGVALGPRLGFAALVVYLAEGAAGLPVFAGFKGSAAVLVGPTGGYLFAFPIAAALAGWLAVRGWDRSPLRMALAMLAGDMLIFAGGLAWLGVWLTLAGKFGGAGALLWMGLLPFLPGEVLKIAVAMVLLPAAWKLIGPSGRS